jgi:hypothetical protein
MILEPTDIISSVSSFVTEYFLINSSIPGIILSGTRRGSLPKVKDAEGIEVKGHIIMKPPT